MRCGSLKGWIDSQINNLIKLSFLKHEFIKTKIWTKYRIKNVNTFVLKLIGICYLVLEQFVTWYSARETCRREGNDADLASINSQHEQNFIESVFYFVCNCCWIFVLQLFQDMSCSSPIALTLIISSNIFQILTFFWGTNPVLCYSIKILP